MEPIASMDVKTCLEHLASKTPAPGGGASASIAGATAAATAGMVLAYSVSKKSLAAYREELASASVRVAEMVTDFLGLADEDAEAYAALNALQRLPEDNERRQAEEPGAVERATAVPQRALELGGELRELLEALPAKTNPQLKSDLAIAAVLAEAACAAAAWNVRVNAPSLPEGTRAPLLGRVETAVRSAGETRGRVEKACM